MARTSRASVAFQTADIPSSGNKPHASPVWSGFCAAVCEIAKLFRNLASLAHYQPQIDFSVLSPHNHAFLCQLYWGWPTCDWVISGTIFLPVSHCLSNTVSEGDLKNYTSDSSLVPNYIWPHFIESAVASLCFVWTLVVIRISYNKSYLARLKGYKVYD